MLSERERRILAQIEHHFRREEPVIAQLLARGTRLTLLRHPEPGTVRALAATILVVTVGTSLLGLGLVARNPGLVVAGLTLAIVGPLPAWLLATTVRVAPVSGLEA